MRDHSLQESIIRLYSREPEDDGKRDIGEERERYSLCLKKAKDKLDCIERAFPDLTEGFPDLRPELNWDNVLKDGETVSELKESVAE